MNKSDVAIELCEQSGVNYKRCYQCKTCSLSCPFTTDMDYLPHQLIRKAQLGELSDLLSSKTIWYCASCETCVTRCPNQIDIPRLMDSLRQMALQKRATMHSLRVSGGGEDNTNSVCY
jgi:heterodisulfide reductase subunit C